MTASAETAASASAMFSGLHKITFVDIILWGLRIAMVAVVVGGTIGTLIKGTYAADQWLDFFLFGLTIGGVYALIALGYTMVYGILRLINFAHGDITMTGAFSAYLPGAQPRSRRLSRQLSDPVDDGDHAAVDGGVHRDGADRRADLLPAVPPCRVARAADLRHRRLLRHSSTRSAACSATMSAPIPIRNG